jgi:hypothetical protein
MIRILATSRPDPSSYFEPADAGEGLLAWEATEVRLAAARNYWVSTTSPSGVPHAMPVWGVWVAGCFLFSTGPRTRKARNILANPRVIVHLESAAQLVVVEGVARQVSEPELIEAFLALYNPKYGWNFTAADLSSGELFEVHPLKAFAWLEDAGSAFSATATRWIFAGPPGGMNRP